MTLRKLLLGFAAGCSAGYLAARAVEAYRELREPSPKRARDAAAYAATRRAIEVADTLRTTASFVAFAQGHTSEWLDRATLRAPEWLRPALYSGSLALAASIVGLPTAFVEEYTLERRYDLSEQSRAAWLSDYVKSSTLSVGLTAFVATLFGYAVRRAPRAWPLLAGLGALPLFVLANLIVPLYVMPLFNAFEPIAGSLEQRLRKLAARYGVGGAEILRMDMSRQTRKANAFVTGIGHTHRIVLGDTLLEHFTENEIEFVVAHELGHYVTKDTWRLMALAESLAVALFVFANVSTPRDEREALRARPMLLARLYAAMLLAGQALRPLSLALSRSREWAADRFALLATGDASGGAAARRRLRDQNLADEDPPAWYEVFFSSHPSLRCRIAALEESSKP
jgi:STE24 endopeptidase